MSSPNNNHLADNEVVEAPKGAAVAVNSGDLVKVTAGLVLPVAAGTDITFGVAQDTSPVTSLLDQLTNIVVIRRGLVRLFLKAGDTAAFNDKLFPTVDPQVVTVTDPGAGVPCGRARVLASTLGAAGDTTRIDLELNAQANS